MRVHLYVADSVSSVALQFHSADKAIPVALRLVGDAVRVLSHANVLNTIVHFDDNGVFLSRHNSRRHIVDMWGIETHLMPHHFTVDRYRGLDVRSFEEECHLPAFPRFRHKDGTCVDHLTHIVFVGSEKEGELHVTLPAVRSHVGIVVERGVVERARPPGVNRKVVTEMVCQQRAR